MSPDEQRTTIADACKWTNIRECSREDLMNSYGPLGDSDLDGCLGSLIGEDPESNTLPIPRYTEDLNAINKAELTLNDYQFKVYTSLLWKTCDYSRRDVVASAAVRSEVFLKALNLWKYDIP